MFLCVFLAGLWQTIFGLAGVAKVIKFTPHPVLVGFLNGVSVLVALSQLKPYFRIDPTTSHLAVLEQPLMFVLLIGTATLMLGFPAAARRLPASWSLTKVPPVVVAFACGIVGFYLLKAINTNFNLGSTVGDLRMTFLSPVTTLSSFEAWRHFIQIGWSIVSTSAVLAIIATLDSLLAFRAAQNVADLAISPVRDLVAQGIGNCAAGLAGGIAGAASPSSSMAAYRAGGRTRLVPVSCGLLLLAASVLAPQALAAIPSIVLAGILLAIGIDEYCIAAEGGGYRWMIPPRIRAPARVGLRVRPRIAWAPGPATLDPHHRAHHNQPWVRTSVLSTASSLRSQPLRS
jgi:MFS superfamily sulfate permease-like transporter